MNRIIQKEQHSTIINHVDHNTQDWIVGDGMITQEKNLGIIAYGADCAIIALWDDARIGVLHTGWRGLVNGMIPKMLKEFNNPVCHIAPFHHQFEIRKDYCYDAIVGYFGEGSVTMNHGKYFFDFKSAVLGELRDVYYSIDNRDTFRSNELASWRRSNQKGNGTQNRLVVWREDDNTVKHLLFGPGESIQDYFEGVGTS